MRSLLLDRVANIVGNEFGAAFDLSKNYEVSFGKLCQHKRSRVR